MGAGAGPARRGEPRGRGPARLAALPCQQYGARPEVSLFGPVGVRRVRGEVRHLRARRSTAAALLAHAGRRRSARTRSGSRARSSRRCCSPPSSATCSPRKASRCSNRKWRGCSPSTAGPGSRTWRRPPRGSRPSSRKSRTSWRRSRRAFSRREPRRRWKGGGRADAVAPDGAGLPQGPGSGGDVPAEHGGAVQAGGG